MEQGTIEEDTINFQVSMHIRLAAPARKPLFPQKFQQVGAHTAKACRSALTPSFFYSSPITRHFGWWYYGLGVLKLLADLLAFAGPMLLHELVDFIDAKSEPVWKGYMYAGLLCLSTLLASLLNTQFSFQANKVQVGLRAAVVRCRNQTVNNKKMADKAKEKKRETLAECAAAQNKRTKYCRFGVCFCLSLDVALRTGNVRK